MNFLTRLREAADEVDLLRHQPDLDEAVQANLDVALWCLNRAEGARVAQMQSATNKKSPASLDSSP